MKTISMNAQARAVGLRVGIAPREPASKEGARPMPARRDVSGAKVLYGLLLLAATVGIGYGFTCLVDFVQSCALFATEVGRLIL